MLGDRRPAGWSDRPVTVTVPASSANLGPGFDSFGLALGLYDEVRLEVAPSGLNIEVLGEGAGTVPVDEAHLVVRSMRAAFTELDAYPPGLRLRCRNAVPHGRGLGSSAGAVIAGIVAVRELAARSGLDITRLQSGGALRLAAHLEGHPDNVAAALLGGLTLAWSEDGDARAVRLQPTTSVVALVPSRAVSTELARTMLPTQVPHADAAANAARAGLLVAALTVRPDLLLAGTEDRLHQEYRASVLADSLTAVRRLRAAGHAAVVSGAGPSVLVLGDPATVGLPARPEVVEELASAVPGWQALALAPDLHGATVSE